MNFKLDSSNTLIILGALVAAAGAYWFFFTGTGNQVPLAAMATSTPAQTQFQALASELEPITFDTSIFTDPRFTALVDIATAITPEPAGRTDPFAPTK